MILMAALDCVAGGHVLPVAADERPVGDNALSVAGHGRAVGHNVPSRMPEVLCNMVRSQGRNI